MSIREEKYHQFQYKKRNTTRFNTAEIRLILLTGMDLRLISVEEKNATCFNTETEILLISIQEQNTTSTDICVILL